MITFPTAPEVFNAYQEQLIGRKQSEKEKGVVAAWVEVFNLTYEDGLTQDRDTLEKDLTSWMNLWPAIKTMREYINSPRLAVHG